MTKAPIPGRRVLIAISRLHCMDGIASNLSVLLPALARHGWEPHFVVGLVDCPPEYQQRLAAIKAAAASYQEEPLLACVNGMFPGIIYRQAKYLTKRAKECGASVLQLEGRALGPAATLCGLLGGPATVNVGQLAPCRTPTLKERVGRLLGRLYGDRVVAISTEMQQQLLRGWGVPANRIRRVWHGVSLQHFRPPTQTERDAARQTLGLPLDAFIVLQLARVSSVKRPHTVVRAVARLVTEGSNAIAVFAGHCDEQELERLNRLANELGIRKQVITLGQVSSQSALWAADAMVLASEREGFPSSVVEAMACGLPVVRTPVEGATDQIEHGVSGLLFPLGDDEQLSQYLQRIQTEPSFAAMLGKAARTRAIGNFSDDAMAKGMISVFEEICG
jgi:glycosyltransferase involved in cell wall biosynthesis